MFREGQGLIKLGQFRDDLAEIKPENLARPSLLLQTSAFRS